MFQSSLRPNFATLSLGLVTMLMACERRPKDASRPVPPPVAQPVESSQPSGALAPVLQLDGATITALSEDHRAEVGHEPGWTYEWTVDGARITSGWSASEVRYTAGEPGQAKLTCKVKDASGREGVALGTQTIVLSPVLGSFVADPPVLTQGEKSALRWEAQEVTRLQLEPGNQNVLQVGGLIVQPTETTTYVLTAANLAGTEVQKTVVLKVVPPPVIKGFTTEGSIKVGQPLTLKAEFAEGKAEIRQNGTVLAASTQSPLKEQVNPTATTLYSLVVTNEGGATTTLTLTLSIQAPAK